jgi:hypothetical protein
MLTAGDDYPIHQTPEPIALAGSDRNFYDRYFFNGYSRDGELFFAAALGVYPQLNIMDAAFCVIHDGVQRNVHASRVLHMERMDTRVGPIRIEVVKPLECLRVVCDDVEHGIQADIRFTGRVAAIQEPRFTRRVGSQMFMDSTRMTQNGSYEGQIECAGTRFTLDPAEHRGSRDRSWGIRPVGERDPQLNPLAGEPQFFWLWAPLNFDEHATFYHLNDDADGKPWNTGGVIAPVGGEARAMTPVGSTLTLKSGTRHAETAELRLGDATIRLEPQYNFYMKGLGYTHPEWGHGRYHGELAVGYDEYRLADEQPGHPTNLHIQAFCRATLEEAGRKHEGCGVLEQLFIGQHAPTGLTGVFDVSP